MRRALNVSLNKPPVHALIVNPQRPAGLEFVSDRPAPSPTTGEVLIRVRLAGICATDLELALGYMDFHGVPGHEFVGTVASGSADLKDKRVVAEINCVCSKCDLCRRGLPTHCRNRTVLGIAGRDGAFADYLTVPAANCHVVPEGVTDAQAVFVEPLAAAVQVVRQHAVEPETRVAVLGTGRLGILIAQVLALEDCSLEVIGRNPHTLALCRQLDLPETHVDEIIPIADRDLVVECTGSPDGLRLALELVRPRGTIVLKSTYAGSWEIDLAPIVIHEIHLAGNRCGPFPDALQLLAEHKIQVDPLVSRVEPLQRGVEAFAAAADPQNVKILLQANTG